jgi:signal transduction histidine kinase
MQGACELLPGDEVALVLLAVVCALVVVAVWRRGQRRVRAAEQAERLAVERRDRFLAMAAAEIDVPLAAGRVEEARRILRELARPSGGVHRSEVSPVDVGELLREIVEAPPFSDQGPPVILRVSPVQVRADRGRLANGLRVLLWTLRREADQSAPLVITVSAHEGEQALIEVEAQGTAAAVQALEHLQGVMQAMVEPGGPPGATLALRVADQVARIHGGRLSARAMAGRGERFVLELPLAA